MKLVPHQSAFARSRLPLYAQVAAELRIRIESGRWAAGQKLPTLEELEEEFGIARVTARQAIGMLEEEGLIWRKQGKGTFVAQALPDRRWLRLATDWSSVMQMIEGSTLRLLGVAPAERPPRLAEDDGRPANGYQHIRRVHVKDEQPYCVIDLYIARDLYGRAPGEFQSRLALQVFSQMPDVRIGSARQTLTIGRADLASASLLEIAVSAPTALVRRVITDATGLVIYFAEILYRGDFVKLDIDFLVHPPIPTREGESP